MDNNIFTRGVKKRFELNHGNNRPIFALVSVSLIGATEEK
jgi:hypothetical protein